MKKTVIILSFVTVLLAFVSLTNSCNSRINVANYKQVSRVMPAVQTSVPLRFSIIQTGYAITQTGFVYRSGSLFKKRKVSHIAVWVQHPKGNFLFDTGLGDSIDTQFSEMNALHEQLFKYKKEKSVRQQLTEKNINPDTISQIILSHLHWDHASAIKDFSKANIIALQEEYDFAQTDLAHSPAFLKSQYTSKKLHWNFLKLENKPYEFFEKSLDYFHDGSIVFVKLGGHTQGSLGMFLTMENGKRYFFTGDITWSLEGFERPSPKHPISSHYVDLDKHALDSVIVKIHRLMQADTNLVVVPAHDWQAQQKLAHFPDFQIK